MSDISTATVDLVPKVYPKDTFDRHHTTVDQDFESLLDDRGKLELLHYMSRSYASLFDTAKNACERIVNQDAICYLIDFDVLCNYLEMGSLSKLETYAVEYLFLDSNVEFAIPVGAFQELRTHICYLGNKVGSVEPFFEPIVSDCGQLEAARAIAKLFTKEDVRCLTIEECSHIFSEELEDYILQLHRLLDILTSPRFLGVKGEYILEHFEGWRDLLETKERRRREAWKSREKVDRYDALNLAVASTSLRSTESWELLQRPRPEYYFELISQTGAVLHLMSHAESEALFNDVAKHNFDLDVLSLKYRFPVLHPNDAMYLELLGGLDGTVGARTTAQSYENRFRELQQHLGSRRFSSSVIESDETYKLAFGQIIAQERQKTKELLESTVYGLLQEEEFRRINLARVQSEVIEVARAKTAGRPESANDRMRRKYVQFSQLLLRTTNELAKFSDTSYGIRESAPSTDKPIHKFEIFPSDFKKKISSQIEGEIYGHFDNQSKFVPAYFSVRWRVSALDEDLIDALQGAWKIELGTSNAIASNPQLLPIDNASTFWTRGIIVHTSFGDYGMPLEVLTGSDNWNVLLYAKLGHIVARDCQKRNTRNGKTIIAEIEQIRLNTSSADILVDVVGAAYDRGTFMTIISHANISENIARMYCDTKLEGGIPDKIRDQLAGILNVFSDPYQ